MGEQIRNVDTELDDVYRRAEERRKRDDAVEAEREDRVAGAQAERIRGWHESSEAGHKVGLGARATDLLVSVSGRREPMGWAERRRLGLK